MVEWNCFFPRMIKTSNLESHHTSSSRLARLSPFPTAGHTCRPLAYLGVGWEHSGKLCASRARARVRPPAPHPLPAPGPEEPPLACTRVVAAVAAGTAAVAAGTAAVAAAVAVAVAVAAASVLVLAGAAALALVPCRGARLSGCTVAVTSAKRMVAAVEETT